MIFPIVGPSSPITKYVGKCFPQVFLMACRCANLFGADVTNTMISTFVLRFGEQTVFEGSMRRYLDKLNHQWYYSIV